MSRRRGGKFWCCAGALGLAAAANYAQVGSRAPVESGSPQLLVQTGLGSIEAMAFSPGSDLLVVGNGTGEAVLLDLAQRKALRRFRHPATVLGVAWMPDGGSFATACADHVVRIWNMRTGAEVRRFTGHTDVVNDVAVSRDGSMLFSASDDKSVRAWDAATGREAHRFDFDERMAAVAVSPDGRALAVGINNQFSFMAARLVSPDGKNGPLPLGKLIDIATWKESQPLLSVMAEVSQLAFSPDGRLLAASTYHGLQVWDARSGKDLAYAAQPQANSVSFAPDSHWVMTGGPEGQAILWDLAVEGSRQPLPKISGYSARVRIAPDGRVAALSGGDGILHIWDMTSRDRSNPTELFQIQGPPYVADANVSIDGRTIRVRYPDWRVTWNLATGQGALEAKGSDAPPEMDAPFGARFSIDEGRLSADGMLNAKADDKGVVMVREVKTGRVRWRLQGPLREILDEPAKLYPVAFFAAATKLLTIDDEQGVKFRVWDVATGAQLKEFGPEDWAMDGYSLSPDGSLIAFGADRDSPDGGHGDPKDRTLSVWSTETASERLPLAFTGEVVRSVLFSPDGTEIYAGEGDGSVAVFDAKTGVRSRAFAAHDGAVTGLAWISGGRVLVTAGSDSTVRFFDAASGKQLALTMASGSSWIVADPRGRFDTNNVDDMPSLSWMAPDDPMRALAPEIFMRQYYTPRLLARVLAGERLPELPGLGSLNRAQPKVEIAAVRVASGGESADVNVALDQTAYLGRVSGARDLRLFRDGQLVGYREGAVELDKNGRAVATFPGIRLPRDEKKVEFSAYAFNVDRVKGTVGAQSVTAPALAAVQARAFILAIGVDRMPAMPSLALRFAAADAERLSGALKTALVAGAKFASVETTVLESSAAHPAGASKAEIREKIAEIARAARPEDFVLIAFSGHGYAEPGGMFHILPSDIAPDRGVLPRGTISTAELTEWLRPVDARDVALVLDSCQSAASVDANGFRPGPMGDAGLGQLAYDKRMLVLAATQSSDAAVESERLREGLLTYSLVKEGLGDGSADWQPKDGRIGLSEWLSYAVRRVPELYAALKSGKLRGVVPAARRDEAQTPSLYDFTKPSQMLWVR